jgi:hypothetical protein
LTSDDLSEAGNTICGIDSAAPDRMDADAMEKMAPTLQKCNLDSTTRKNIASNIVSKTAKYVDINVSFLHTIIR